jgi:hypothetical protein
MCLLSTTVAGAQTIKAWIAADSYHAGQPETFYLERSVAATKLEDEQDTVLYMRMDRELNAIRLCVQFAPIEIAFRLRKAFRLVRMPHQKPRCQQFRNVSGVRNRYSLLVFLISTVYTRHSRDKNAYGSAAPVAEGLQHRVRAVFPGDICGRRSFGVC